MNDPPHDSDLDDLFPGEEGGWDTDADVVCPYCGEVVNIGLDPGGGGDQTYVEDCEVCCQPWQVRLHYDSEGHAVIELETA